MIDREKAMRDIWWIFRSAIHGEHTQIKIEGGKAEAFKDLPDTSCYVCDVIMKVEKQIADLFGVEYYTCEKIEKEENT